MSIRHSLFYKKLITLIEGKKLSRKVFDKWSVVLHSHRTHKSADTEKTYLKQCGVN